MYYYYYAWENNEKRLTLYKRRCKIIAASKKNSLLIEFENGQRECVSRNAIRKIKEKKSSQFELFEGFKQSRKKGER